MNAQKTFDADAINVYFVYINLRSYPPSTSQEILNFKGIQYKYSQSIHCTIS